MADSPKTELWDEEKVYDAEIQPLMAQIIAICRRAKIPMVASFAYGRTDESVLFCTTLIDHADVGRDVQSFRVASGLIRNGIAGVMVVPRPPRSDGGPLH